MHEIMRTPKIIKWTTNETDMTALSLLACCLLLVVSRFY